jgi:hemoglobin
MVPPKSVPYESNLRMAKPGNFVGGSIPVSTLFDRLGGRTGLRSLVVRFYDLAQADELLGPVFARHVHDWESHYETVTDFWSTQTGGPAVDRGGMGRHLMLGLTPAHFERWLKLWVENARQVHGDGLAANLETIGRVFAVRLIQMQGANGIHVGNGKAPGAPGINPGQPTA